MSDGDKLVLFDLLGLLTTTLSIVVMVLSFYRSWQYVAGLAIFACIIYQVRIWLIRPPVK